MKSNLSKVTSSGFARIRKETIKPSPSVTNTTSDTTSTKRLSFLVPALSATMTASSGPSSTSITITCGFRFLAIVEGLVAKNEEMLDGFNHVIALDDMECKLNLVFPTEQYGRKAHIRTSGLLGEIFKIIGRIFESDCSMLLWYSP